VGVPIFNEVTSKPTTTKFGRWN